MQKTYNRINWENYPSDRTPLNETNLNKLDVGVNELDNRIITLDNTKFDKTEASQLIKNFELDKATGVITITYLSGATATIDTMLEKLAVNFDFDKENQKLVIILDDGSTKEVDLTALITEYEFKDTETVAFTIDANGNVSAIIKDGSIQEQHLRPNYLADIRVESAKAEASAVASDASAIASESSAVRAESWAVGGTNTRTDEDTDNAKYYYEASKQIYNDFENVGAVVGVKGDNESDYRTGFVNITAENVGALPSKVVISQVNFDDLKTTGIYHIQSAVATNRPTDSHGTLIVDFNVGTPYQIWIPDHQNIAYKRTYQNSTTWSAWGKMEAGKADSATKATQDGDGNIITKQYMIGKLITDNVDFNDMQKSGIYHMKGINDTNKPTSGNGTLFVDFSVGTPYQIWIQDNQYVMYKRIYSNGAWSEWDKLDVGHADSATKATQDGNGNNISDTYATKGEVLISKTAPRWEDPLSTYTTTGVYHIPYGGQTDNPTTTHGTLFVDSTVGTLYQLWISDAGYAMYKRISYNRGTTWESWSKMDAGKADNDSNGNKITDTYAKKSDILNTATAIEASTSDDNIVGAKGLKDYVEEKLDKTVIIRAKEQKTIDPTEVGVVHGALMHIVKVDDGGSRLYSIRKSNNWRAGEIYSNIEVSDLNVEGVGMGIYINNSSSSELLVTFSAIS